MCKKYLNPELNLDKLAKLRNYNSDQGDVSKDQIKSDDLIERVEHIKADNSLMQFTEWQCVSNPKNKKKVVK